MITQKKRRQQKKSKTGTDSKMVLKYLLNNAKSSILLFFPTIEFSKSLRQDLESKISVYGNIVMLKKIKFSFQEIKQIYPHLFLEYMTSFQIERDLILNLSWSKGENKYLYLYVWEPKTTINKNRLESILTDFLIDYEFQRVAGSNFEPSADITSVRKSKSYPFKLQEIVEEDSVSIIDKKVFPFGSLEDDMTTQFVSGILEEKKYIIVPSSYQESVQIGKVILNKSYQN